MKKRFMIILSIIAFVGIIFSVSVPLYWVGKTEDGQWLATYKEEGPKERWFGTLQWNGSSEVILEEVHFRKNNATIIEFNDNIILDPGEFKTIEFVAFSEKPSKQDKLELEINWSDGTQSHKRIISLKPTRISTLERLFCSLLDNTGGSYL